MMNLKRMGLAIAILATMSGRTDAGIFIDFAGNVDNGSSTTFLYNLAFRSSGETLQSGNSLTIFDYSTSLLTSSSISFTGDITVSIVPTAPIDPLAPPFTPPLVNNPTINDIVFTYTGSNFTTDGNIAIVAITLPGRFTAGASAPYISRSGATGGVSSRVSGFVTAPLAAVVPEPMSMTLLGFGVISVAVAMRHRRRSSLA